MRGARCFPVFDEVGGRRRLAVGLAAWCALAAGMANAQTPPGAVAPGLLERRFEPPAVPQRQLEAPPTPEAEQPYQAPPGAAAVRFVLHQITIEGATVYGEAELRAVYANLVGQDISLVDVYRMAEALTNKYRGDGYILSRVIVPPQRVREGAVTLRAVEGHLEHVHIQGEQRGNGGLLQAYAQRLLQARPLRAADLERYVLLANSLPGLKVRASLGPSDVPGASDLLLTVEENPLTGELAFDNRGSRSVGPYQAFATANLNSLLGWAERTTLRGIATTQIEELRFLEANHEQQIGTDGAKLNFTASRTLSDPGFTLKSFDLHSVSERLSSDLSYPLIRSRNENLTLSAGFAIKNATTDFVRTRLTDDRMRVGNLVISYDFADQLILPAYGSAINLIRLDVDHGFNVLGETRTGSALLSNRQAHSDFTKFTLDLYRYQQLPPPYVLILAVSAQKSLDPLVSSEGFIYGGSNFGRAYDPAELVGDDGIAGKAEVQYTYFVEEPYLKYLQPYVYVDAGLVRQLHSTLGDNTTRTAHSLGGGFRFTFTDTLTGYFEAAQPLGRGVSARGDDGNLPRLFFRLQKTF